MQYSTVSYGSEGKKKLNRHFGELQYSTFSDGSEGCSYIHCFCHMLQYSMISHGSEGATFIMLFCEKQFKINVQGFIFMNLYWPIGNCRYQLAFSFIEIIYVLQCPLELGSQGLLFSYYICRFCVCFFYEMPVISHKNLAFFPNQNGKI